MPFPRFALSAATATAWIERAWTRGTDARMDGHRADLCRERERERGKEGWNEGWRKVSFSRKWLNDRCNVAQAGGPIKADRSGGRKVRPK